MADVLLLEEKVPKADEVRTNDTLRLGSTRAHHKSLRVKMTNYELQIKNKE